MTYLPYVVLGASLFIPVVQFILIRRTRRMEGQDAPATNDLIDEKLRSHGQVLLYFFLPKCDACQVMAPRIDRLASEHANIIKLDARETKDIARSLGILATPTVVLLKNGKVARIIAGIASEKKVEALLK